MIFLMEGLFVGESELPDEQQMFNYFKVLSNDKLCLEGLLKSTPAPDHSNLVSIFTSSLSLNVYKSPLPFLFSSEETI